jgi:2-aminobenzoate-CoA ligase
MRDLLDPKHPAGSTGEVVMSRIPDEYLPPEEVRPSRVYLVPEVQGYPNRLNPGYELVDRHVEDGKGEKPAIFFQDRVITYGALAEQSNRLGNVLASRGVEEEDRVVILSPNQPLSLTANFAALKVGAVPVPASPLLSPPEVSWVVNNSEARALLVHTAMLPLIEKAKRDFAGEPAILGLAPPSDELTQAGIESALPLMEKADAGLEPVPREKDRVGILLYTSGTTGKPKGVVHLVEEMLAVADTFGHYGWKLRDDDVVFSPAPLAFAAGYGAMAVIPFRFGAAVSVMPRFEPDAAFETVQQHHATVLTILPTSYRKMLQVEGAEKFDLSSVRMCTGGGEALTAETYRQWLERFGLEIFEGFGTTEMFYVFVSAAATEKAKPGSIGTPVPGYEVKVVSEEGNEVGPGEIGRMVARGPTGTLYWRPHEENGRLMESQRHAVVERGWNVVGDFLHGDEDGYFWFVSREDDLIKSSGYRIGPEEIEMVIAKHPAVADVGVIGVPDPVRGQNTKAVVVLKEGQTATADEIIDFCRNEIAVYKLPREVEFVETLPRTVTGKLLRRVLREGTGAAATG